MIHKSNRLACLISMLVATGSIAACSGAPGDGSGAEGASGEGARTEVVVSPPPPLDAGIDAAPSAPLGLFACGPKLSCDGTSQYCQVTEGGIYLPLPRPPFPPNPPGPTYVCQPLPASCDAVLDPTCACIDPVFPGPIPLTAALPLRGFCVNVTGGSVVSILSPFLGPLPASTGTP